MPQFEEVLDGVRLALTWASPVDIGALLKGLVEQQIISEGYRKSLSLHRLAEAFAPGSELRSSRGSTAHWNLDRGPLSQSRDQNQTRSASPVDEHYTTGSWPKHQKVIQETNPHLIEGLRGGPVMDEHYPNLFSTPSVHDCQCNLRFDDEMAELLRSAELMQKQESDSERKDEGNLEDEKEWLEQVEEAARRIAVPLWQHWDRGRRMLMPLVPEMTAGCKTSEKTATDSEAQCPVLTMEEEEELAFACRTIEYTFNFKCTEGQITDPNFTSDTKALCFSGSTGLDTDHFNTVEAGRIASPVQACAATDTNNNITGVLEGERDMAKRKSAPP
ncbi:uncharacterized protein LOC131982801 [Centropristis striata]|uniref:uncharacterized protein LOC131982801 n=1 Tax=Centropristis striata TaxID=184440 RepID=UPI0027E1D045|nr:uncharacterized protein LOC131982801 [Centropristis striata]